MSAHFWEALAASGFGLALVALAVLLYVRGRDAGCLIVVLFIVGLITVEHGTDALLSLAGGR